LSADDLELATRFLETLALAAQTGDREALYPFLAPDVEWETPQRDLRGIDEVRAQLTWLSPPERLDIEFDRPRLEDRGNGRIISDVHETYRLKETGELAYERDRRIELTIRDRSIAHYRMTNVVRGGPRG
jgi:ketosteroid isomerase-like protein